MEADFCLAKRLGMNQGIRSTRLFARWAIPPRQGLHAFVRHRQNGGYAGGRFEFFREEQTRKCSQSDDTVCHLIHFPFVLTIPSEETSAYVSESRKLTKVHHSAFKFFSTGNIPNERNIFFHT